MSPTQILNAMMVSIRRCKCLLLYCRSCQCLPYALACMALTSAHLEAIVGMVGVCRAKKVELHVVGLIRQDLLLESKTYIDRFPLVLSMIRRS